MIRSTRRRVLRGGLGAAIVGAALLGSATPAFADHEGDLFGVDINNVLYRYEPTDPGTIKQQAPITGLEQGAVILGIDFRPTDGEIYGITQNERIYRINYRPNGFAAAQFVSSLTNLAGTAAGPQLTGTNFGFDFNPAVDRLRVVSDRGQNLRINVDNGATTVDTQLSYQSGDPNAGKAPRVTAVAYNNPDNDDIDQSNGNQGTPTELFDLDPGQTGQNDIISKQVDPNGGVLATRGTTGVNNANLVGYDIDIDQTGYVSVQNVDVAALLMTIRFDGDPATNDTPVVGVVGPINTQAELRDQTVGLIDADRINPFDPSTPAPDPVIPEVPVAALLPLLGLGVVGAVVVRRRRLV